MDPQPPSSPPPSYQSPSSPGPGGGSSFANLDPRVRNLAIGLFVLALLVLVGTFTSSWGSVGEEGGAGLTGIEACRRDQCMSISWGDIPKMPADFQIFGWLATLGGLASAAGAIAIGVFAMTNKPNKIPPKVLQIVLGVTAFAMTFFLIRVLTADQMKGIDISYSGILAIGGIIGIGVVSKMLYALRPYQA